MNIKTFIILFLLGTLYSCTMSYEYRFDENEPTDEKESGTANK